ncbi:MAG TPA: glycosyltransferase family 1 protein [Patescibacteria group bacterium]|nr:glycosyltransferase family 1 protein [Patescibacteria group bacterium]
MIIGIDVRHVGKNRTGDETVFVQLVRALARIDRENTYILFTDRADTSLVGTLGIAAAKNFSVCVLSCANRFVWNAWTLPLFLRTHHIDIYHTQYIVPFFLPSALRVVVHIHDVSFCAFPQFIALRDRIFLRLLIPRSVHRGDAMIAPSRFTAKEIEKFYPKGKGKIHVVHNALPEEFLSSTQSKDRDAAVAQKYHLPEKYIFTLGTMQPRKNIPALIAAYAAACKTVPGTSLVISGPRGHHFDSVIDEEIRRNPHVRERIIFTGYIAIDDLPVVYRHAHLFIFPSLYEGFGIPLLEAMSQGVPVLASDLSVFREVAANAAIYCDTRTLDQFAKSIYTMSIDRNLRSQSVGNAPARVSSFSWEESAKKLLRIYQLLISKS